MVYYLVGPKCQNILYWFIKECRLCLIVTECVIAHGRRNVFFYHDADLFHGYLARYKKLFSFIVFSYFRLKYKNSVHFCIELLYLSFFKYSNEGIMIVRQQTLQSNYHDMFFICPIVICRFLNMQLQHEKYIYKRYLLDSSSLFFISTLYKGIIGCAFLIDIPYLTELSTLVYLNDSLYLTFNSNNVFPF